MAYLDLNPHVVGIYLVHRLTSNDSMSNLGISHNSKNNGAHKFQNSWFLPPKSLRDLSLSLWARQIAENTIYTKIKKFKYKDSTL